SPIGYYIPIAQSDVANGVRIAVRTRGQPAAVTSLVRAAVASLDADLALYEISTMRSVIDRQTLFYTIFGNFFMAFGFSAVFLASAGLYGVMSFAVTQRTREMGVRSALGARGRQLIVLVMRKSVLQLAIGLVLGLSLAAAASGLLQPVLYHVNPRDVVVFGGVVATLTLTTLGASLLPALRVTRVDPVLEVLSETTTFLRAVFHLRYASAAAFFRSLTRERPSGRARAGSSQARSTMPDEFPKSAKEFFAYAKKHKAEMVDLKFVDMLGSWQHC